MYIFTIDIYLEVVVFFLTYLYFDLYRSMHILNINACTQTDTHIYIIHNIIELNNIYIYVYIHIGIKV
jgi:hypothetical protein